MSFNSVCKSSDLSRRHLLMAAACWVAWPAMGASAPAEVRNAISDARLVGQGRLRYLGLHIYDAALWSAAAGEPSLDSDTLALELRYARGLNGSAIAERSLKEMQRVDAINAEDSQRWLQEMTALFPNVAAGDRITGLHRPQQGARFYLNGRVLGDVRDVAFSKHFFGIWLSPRTSQPALRSALLGKNSSPS
jgi:Chalcone isomerase-like